MDEHLKAQVNDMLGGGSGASGTYWNFSNPNEENFSPTLVGDLVEISFTQKKKWNPETRKFEGQDYWEDGNPKLNFLLHFVVDGGEEMLYELQKGSKSMREDWLPACPSGNLMGLIGMRVQVDAAQPPINPQTGQPIPFSSAMRRTFKVTPLGPASTAARGVDYDSYTEVMSHKLKAQQQAPVPPAMMGNPYAQQYAQQQAYQQPAMNAAMQAAYSAAQAAGYTAAQQPARPVAQPGYSASAPAPVQAQQPPVDVYDADIPF